MFNDKWSLLRKPLLSSLKNILFRFYWRDNEGCHENLPFFFWVKFHQRKIVLVMGFEHQQNIFVFLKL